MLRAARFQLEEDLKDKYQAFDIDTVRVAHAACHPATGDQQPEDQPFFPLLQTCRELNSTFGNLSDTTRLRQQTEQ